MIGVQGLSEAAGASRARIFPDCDSRAIAASKLWQAPRRRACRTGVDPPNCRRRPKRRKWMNLVLAARPRLMEPGLPRMEPGVERYRIAGGGAVVLPLHGGDRLDIIDVEG